MNPIKTYPVDEIISFVMKDVDAKTFLIGINNGSFQFLYENKKNHLVSNYFDNNTLKYSIVMSEIFKPYNDGILKLSENKNRFEYLKGAISRAKRYKGDLERIKTMITEYNLLIAEFNEISKPIRRLINKHYKLNNK